VIYTLHGDGQILKAAFVASPYVSLGNVVTSGQDPISDASEIDFDILGSDINQQHIESQGSCGEHHVQVILPGQCVVSTAKLSPLFRCSPADLRTWRAAATGSSADAVAWSVLAIASGSRTGISLNSSGFQRVSVVLPEPFAPAMKVIAGWLTERTVQISFDAPREFLASVFSRSRPPPERLAPSFAQLLSSSQPQFKNTPTRTLF
jgi:hypothetical protein